MRNPGDVIDKLLLVEGVSDQFIAEILKASDSLRYCAPENIGYIWGRLGETVSAAVQNKPYDTLVGWELKIVDILMDKK